MNMRAVTGLATLDGTLDVALANGYGPVSGDSYTIANFGASTGSFASQTGLAPLFTDAINPTAIVLNAVATAADLAVSNVSEPASGTPGDSVTVNYTVQNLSGSTATGPWTDSVYLSTDQTLDASDTLLGSGVHTGNVAVSGSYIGGVTATLPVIANGNYYLIVVTDSGKAVPDTNRTNNTAVSAATLQLTQVPLRVLSASPTGVTNNVFGQFTVTFDKPINPTTFTLDQVVITGPNGMVAATTITELSGSSFRVSFASQNTNGTYTVTIGPRIADLLGGLMDQNNNGTPGEPSDVYTFTVTVSLPDLAPFALVVPPSPSASIQAESDRIALRRANGRGDLAGEQQRCG